MHHIKNLNGISFRGRVKIERAIDQLFVIAAQQDSAYEFTMPLLGAALLGDQDRYYKILPYMLEALNSIENTDFKFWLLGRVLLAADCIGDQATFKNVKQQMSEMIEGGELPKTAFTSWGLSYYAGVDQNEYYRVRESLKAVTTWVTENDTKSNAMWTLVMALEAASKAEDRDHCDDILSAKKALAETEHVHTAMAATIAEGDYPAWAGSSARRSAARMGQERLFESLTHHVRPHLMAAQQKAHPGDFVLAMLNHRLTHEEWKAHRPAPHRARVHRPAIKAAGL